MDSAELDLPEDSSPASPACASCKTPLYGEVYKTPLCPECRQAFIRFPIPKWIKAFGGGILLLLLFCLVTLPRNLRTGIHHKRGMEAMAQRKFSTAQKELEAVVKAEPKFLEAQCRLIIAAFYNGDLITMQKAYAAVVDKTIDDEDLIGQVQDVLAKTVTYLPSDSLLAFIEAKHTSLDSSTSFELTQYLQKQPGDQYAMTMLASRLMDAKEYEASDRVLQQCLALDRTYNPALAVMIPLKRERLQFDSALYYADRVLANNRESAYGYGAKARILLKAKKDAEALKVVKEGLAIDSHDPYCLATLAIAYHYTGDLKHRDALLKQAATDSTLTSPFSFASDVISGKEAFRN